MLIFSLILKVIKQNFHNSNAFNWITKNILLLVILPILNNLSNLDDSILPQIQVVNVNIF